MVAQYRAFWQIPDAGPAVSTFHLTAVGPSNVVAAAQSIADFLGVAMNSVPNDVTVTFDSEMTVYNDATGQLTATVPVTPPQSTTGLVASQWAAGSGLRVDWLTPFIRNGRRVRGRTFIVPAGLDAFTNSGQVSGPAISQMTAAGATMVNELSANASPLCIYARPTPGNAGQAYNVTSVAVPTQAATLRGRKG